MKRLIALLVCALAAYGLCACSSRNGSASASEPASSQATSSASSEEPVRSAPSRPPRASSEEASASEPAYETPLLTDTELEMLSTYLELFVLYTPDNPVLASGKDLDPELALSACIQEVERSADVNALIIPQNDKKQNMVEAEMITRTAEQLFGMRAFAPTESPRYDKASNSFVSTDLRETARPHTTSALRGAANENVAYTVTFDDKPYTYVCKILRQNGIPYMQLISIERDTSAASSEAAPASAS